MYASPYNRNKLVDAIFFWFTIISTKVTKTVSGNLVQELFNQNVIMETANFERQQKTLLECGMNLNSWVLGKRKGIYRVGVLAIRGFEAAFEEFNSTFSDFLSASAGASFDPPIRFEVKPLDFNSIFKAAEVSEVDFIYVNPSAYSCIESEFGANSLVSQISLRKVGGKYYNLTQFGGVIIARADSDIHTITDIRDKSVACASINGLGSGQAQFRLMQQFGLSYINDPKQVVFTSNQRKVVNGVLDGKFDIGFVRTDQIEKTNDKYGNAIDSSLLKIIEPQENLYSDGVHFPFPSSTELYAEWNVAALTHVAEDVSAAVQNAMLNLASHAEVGAAFTQCYSDCITNSSTFPSQNDCKNQCDLKISTMNIRCDTNIPLALLAHQAKIDGKYSGWRTTLSYMELRNMQEEISFIQKNRTTGKMQCRRSSDIYNVVSCPPGHFKKTKEDVLNGCADVNLECPKDFQCICRPCVRAFDVDVAPYGVEKGCAKMSNCGSVEQTKEILFRAIDNKKRNSSTMKVKIHEGRTSRDILARPISFSNPFEYEFVVKGNEVGIQILEILLDDEQIPESPLRLEVTPRDCVSDTNDGQRTADFDGNCICVASAWEIGGSCVALSILLPFILLPIFTAMIIALYFFLDIKKRKTSASWANRTSEILFDDTHELNKRGKYGLVMLGEYRGKQVVVKRVIAPHVRGKNIDPLRSYGKDESINEEDDDDYSSFNNVNTHVIL